MVIIKLIEAAAIRRLNHDSPFHCGGGAFRLASPGNFRLMSHNAGAPSNTVSSRADAPDG